MEVIEPGSQVFVGPDRELEGSLLRVFVEIGGVVRYRVQYWEGGTRKTNNFLRGEVSLECGAERSIGFSQDTDSL